MARLAIMKLSLVATCSIMCLSQTLDWGPAIGNLESSRESPAANMMQYGVVQAMAKVEKYRLY